METQNHLHKPTSHQVGARATERRPQARGAERGPVPAGAALAGGRPCGQGIGAQRRLKTGGPSARKGSERARCLPAAPTSLGWGAGQAKEPPRVGPAPGRGKPALLSPSQALSSADPAELRARSRLRSRSGPRAPAVPQRPDPRQGRPGPQPLTPASPRRAGEPRPRRPCLGRARRWPAAGSTKVSTRPTRPFPEGLQGPSRPDGGPRPRRTLHFTLHSTRPCSGQC